MLLYFVISAHAAGGHVQVQGPAFQTNILQKDQNISKFLEYFNRDVEISGNFSSSFRSNEYFHCTITLKKATFTGNYAFGSSISSASGGALYASHSQISTTTTTGDKSTFTSNEASIGGGICFIACKAYFKETVFTGNTVHKFGGAFYFQGISEESNIDISQQYLKLDACQFTGNTAHDVGGALCFSNAAHSQIDGTTFDGNKAELGGGAIYCMQTELLIKGGHFKTNTVNVTRRNTDFDVGLESNTLNRKYNTKSTGFSRFSARGGGAILFTSIEPESTLRLETSGVCFKGNTVTSGDTFNPTNTNSGDNVLLDGDVTYFSNKDGMDVHKIARSARKLSIFYNYEPLNGDLSGCTGEDNKTNSQTVHSFAKQSNTGDDRSTSGIPDPTPYTYVATPITKLPLPTTESHITFPTTKLKVIPENVNPPSEPASPPTVATLVPPPPARTPIPIITPKPGQKGKETVTKIETYSNITTTKINTIVVSYDPDNRPYYITTEITGEFTIVTVVVIESTVNLAIEETPAPPKSNTMYIIIGVVAGIILLVAAALLIWFVVAKKKKEDEESNSTVEMVEETVTIAPTTSNTITNDNPLWTTSFVGDDDPFKKDFEEEGVEVFFDVKDVKELE